MLPALFLRTFDQSLLKPFYVITSYQITLVINNSSIQLSLGVSNAKEVYKPGGIYIGIESVSATRQKLTFSSTAIYSIKMRSFGTEISGNRRPQAELSPETRAAILNGLENQRSHTQLAKEFGVSRRTIYTTKERFQQHKTLESRPRTGRPQKLSAATKRYICQMVRRSPSMSWKALVAYTPGGLSKSTIQRVLRRYNVKKGKSKKIIPLKHTESR
jgi:transposase-like protein